MFGAKELRRFADQEGILIHSEVQIDDSVIMIAYKNENWPSVPAHVHVYVADVDETYRQAIDAGALPV